MIDQIDGMTAIQPETEKKAAKPGGKSKGQTCPKCNSPGKLVGQSTFGMTTCEQHRCKSTRCGYLWSALTQPLPC
ncbi:MAG: hypothetical protein JWO38_4715 [Gemmataceae bacterium]|nr:hypothetical protein [Gemmataceae bacterium]